MCQIFSVKINNANATCRHQNNSLLANTMQKRALTASSLLAMTEFVYNVISGNCEKSLTNCIIQSRSPSTDYGWITTSHTNGLL